MKKYRLAILLAVAALGGTWTAAAHHSYAVFDATKKVTITGTVKRFDFMNPHTWLVVVVTDPKTGGEVDWRLEGADPSILAKRGWKRTSLKPGDPVSVLLNPLRDGSPGGSFLEVTSNGVVLGVSH